MTWEIVAGIIALGSFIGVVCGYVSKLSNTLATLTATLDGLKKLLDEFRSSNSENHKEIFSRLEDHDRRISRIECKEETK